MLAVEYRKYDRMTEKVSFMTEDDHCNARVEALDTMLDAGGADEAHPLAALADRMGELVAQYEEAHLLLIPAAPKP